MASTTFINYRQFGVCLNQTVEPCSCVKILLNYKHANNEKANLNAHKRMLTWRRFMNMIYSAFDRENLRSLVNPFFEHGLFAYLFTYATL